MGEEYTGALAFNAEGVRGILEDRKVMTRRMIELPADMGEASEDYDFDIDAVFINGERRDWPYAIADESGCLAAIECPYGEPGDLLWVQEEYCGHWCACEGREGPSILDRVLDLPPCAHKNATKLCGGEEIPQDDGSISTTSTDSSVFLYYRATNKDDDKPDHIDWQPADDMPQYASRIQLRVKYVRVERLKDISEDDAIAEGYPLPGGGGHNHVSATIGLAKRGFFAGEWASKHYDDNPWVWVIEFERVQS